MRRTDREITDIEEIKKILDEAQVLRIALNNGKYPYLLPVNFGYETSGDRLVLFFHGAKEGTKHEIIRKDPHATFEVDCEHVVMQPVRNEACTASFAYASVIGHGVIESAAEEEKERLLLALLKHYGMSATLFRPGQVNHTHVYKLYVESCTAKRKTTDR